MPEELVGTVDFFDTEDLVNQGYVGDIDRIENEASFSVDYQNDELTVENAQVLIVRNSQPIRATIVEESIGLESGAVNDIYLGVKNTGATLVSTSGSGPVWSSFKIGEVDVPQQQTSTVSAKTGLEADDVTARNSLTATALCSRARSLVVWVRDKSW